MGGPGQSGADSSLPPGCRLPFRLWLGRATLGPVLNRLRRSLGRSLAAGGIAAATTNDAAMTKKAVRNPALSMT